MTSTAGRFDEARGDSLERQLCSPSIDDAAFFGIVLDAPSEVTIDEGRGPGDPFARVMVAGTYRLPAGYLGLGEAFLGAMALVVVDTGRHTARVAPAWASSGFARVPSGPPLGDDELRARAGQAVTGHFTQNLAEHLELPEVAADYVVYATLGEHVSNVLEITVKRRPNRGAGA